jgi:glutamate carboxypeptidase
MTGLSPSESRIVDHLKGRQSAMAADVIDWAQVNSGSRNLTGLATMHGLIADRLVPIADTVASREPDPVTTLNDKGEEVAVPHGANLLARKREGANRRLILTGHMDTVFPPEHPFQSSRLTDSNTLNGPGTADMKGGLLVMIEALDALEQAGAIPGLGWDVVVNADEEVSSLGSASLLREIARQAQIGITFEPSVTPHGTLASARRGSGNFIAAIAGRAAHAGRAPQDGRNAVVAAADLALRLDAMKREIPGLSVNVARASGGGANNVVPDKAALCWNMRPLDPEAQHKAQHGITAAIAAVEAAHDVAIRMSGHFARPPKPFDPPHEALFGLVRDTGADLGLRIDWQPSGGVCDGNNIAAENVVVVDTMGARGGAIHTADEFLLIDSLSERAALAALTILRIAEGRLDPIFAQKGVSHV